MSFRVKRSGEITSKAVVDAVFSDASGVSEPSDTALQVIRNRDKEVFDLLAVYSKCVLALRLPGNSSVVSLLNAICCQTLESISLQKKRNAIEEMEAKRKLFECSLNSLRKDVSTATTQMKQSKECKKHYSEKIQFYTKKFREYHQETKLLEEHLSSLGFNSALKDESLTSLREENRKLNEEMKECAKKLEELSEFECNNVSLSKRIAEMNREIKNYNKYFNRESL